MSKFESKRSKSLDYIAYSGFKDFDQKNFILRAKHEILKKYAIYVFIESQKVLIVCIFARQYRREYRGWCKFESPPGIGLSLGVGHLRKCKQVKTALMWLMISESWTYSQSLENPCKQEGEGGRVPRQVQGTTRRCYKRSEWISNSGRCPIVMISNVMLTISFTHRVRMVLIFIIGG